MRQARFNIENEGRFMALKLIRTKVNARNRLRWNLEARRGV